MRDLGVVERGRDATARRHWREAYEALALADAAAPLAANDLELLATAAYLVGDDAQAIALWKRLHHELADAGRIERAARFGFWLGFCQLLRGQVAESRGWVARTQRLLEGRPPCVEQGYVLGVEGLLALGSGDAAGARTKFEQAITCAGRFGEPDLLAMGLIGRGQSLILLGDTTGGVASVDEAMVTVVAGGMSPILTGILYCASILTYQQILDVGRAREWTLALGEWCASQPQSVSFRGECLVHRCEILLLQGDWSGAREEAERACATLSDRTQPLAGRAFYLRGELYRLRGELDLAETMYREALRNGFEPQPGVSLLRLAQGQLESAAAAIRRVVGEARDRPGPGARISRTSVLGPYVEIMIAADLPAARVAADELVAIAAKHAVPLVRAIASQAIGAVLLEEGDANAALVALREAWTTWQELDAPYESARVRVLIARACEQLGDHDTAKLHGEAAAAVFERLGATADAERLRRSSDRPRGAIPLTDRELEVLALVAVGKTNRQIAADLTISEHTVARHLSNIFNKIGVGSRTAASAFAHAHHLV